MTMNKGFSRLGALLLVLAVPALILFVSTFNIDMKDGGASRNARILNPAVAVAASPLPGPEVVGNLSNGGIINGCGGIINNCAAGICGTMAPCLSNYSRVMCFANAGAPATPTAVSTAAAMQCWPTASYATVTLTATPTTTATAGTPILATQTISGTGIFVLLGTATNQASPTIAWYGVN
jgi:hypothetical protein